MICGYLICRYMICVGFINFLLNKNKKSFLLRNKKLFQAYKIIKKLYMTLSYIKHLLILLSLITRCVSVSAFALLIDIVRLEIIK